MNRRQMRYYVDQVIALQPDLFVLTGDYISNSLSFLPVCVEEMARVRARYGTFATLGNHEHWYGSLIELRTIFRRYGMPLLNNEHQVIQTERGLFAVIGIDDLRTGEGQPGGRLTRVGSCDPETSPVASPGDLPPCRFARHSADPVGSLPWGADQTWPAGGGDQPGAPSHPVCRGAVQNRDRKSLRQSGDRHHIHTGQAECAAGDHVGQPDMMTPYSASS